MKIRLGLSDFTPYSWEASTREVASTNGLKVSQIHRMDTNTSPYIPKEALSSLAHEAGKLPVNEYPDTTYLELRSALADYTKTMVDQIVLTNGADEALDIIAKLLLDPKDEVLIPTPTYSMYRIASQLANAKVIRIPRDSTFDISPDSIARRVSKRTKLLFMCNPNNPTGNSTSSEQIRSILESNRNLTVVIDEAYSEFSRKSSSKLVDDHNNLVIVRTLSKAFSMAGIRVGYIISSVDSTKKINLVRPPNSLGVLSLFMAQRALEHVGTMRKNVNLIIKERERMSRVISGICEVFPSEANFVLFRPRKSAKKLHSRMMKKGFVLREFSGVSMIEDCLRVTVNTPSVNSSFLKALAKELQA